MTKELVFLQCVQLVWLHNPILQLLIRESKLEKLMRLEYNLEMQLDSVLYQVISRFLLHQSQTNYLQQLSLPHLLIK
jgi:hypothetical protein